MKNSNYKKKIKKSNQTLTENALRKTRHCMMPSMVSPVRQKVPLRCLPFRPYTVDKEACTNALLLLFNCDVGNSAFDKGRKRFSQIKRSNDSIIKFFALIKKSFFGNSIIRCFITTSLMIYAIIKNYYAVASVSTFFVLMSFIATIKNIF